MHDTTMGAFGARLRAQRVALGLSQEELGARARVSPRHLSCLETGKAQPSREMVLRISRVLGLDLRDRNLFLAAAGFAPVYASTPLDSAAMQAVRAALDALLAKQEPYPAVLLDRSWNVLRANAGAERLLETFMHPKAPSFIARNMVLATMDLRGLKRSIVNWQEVAPLVLERVERAARAHPGDDDRQALLEKVRTYPGVTALPKPTHATGAPTAVLVLGRGHVRLTMFALLTTVGTPLDVTAEDLIVESLFPADDTTAAWFRGKGKPRPTAARNHS